jgi:tRNA(adenine34) deaminase
MFEQHKRYMNAAIEEARKAIAAGEVPVGAIVVYDKKIVAASHNRVEEYGLADSHAEIIALREATGQLNGVRLTGCTLYCTLEPCPMCAFAALLYRVDAIIYGAADPKSGGCGSVVNIPAALFNHTPEVIAGVMEKECGAILKEFFYSKRDS